MSFKQKAKGRDLKMPKMIYHGAIYLSNSSAPEETADIMKVNESPKHPKEPSKYFIN